MANENLEATAIDPVVWNDLEREVLRLGSLAVDPPLSMISGPAGVRISLMLDPGQWLNITGTRTMGGAYAANPVSITSAGIASNTAAVSTSSLWNLSTGSTYTFLSMNEVGSSFHFLGSNTYVQARSVGGFKDKNNTLSFCFMEAIPLPSIIRTTFTQTGGTNGTVSGGVPTFSTGTYTFTYNGQTLATGQTLDWSTPRFAGEIVWASKGLVQVNGTGANISFVGISGNEIPAGGISC